MNKQDLFEAKAVPAARIIPRRALRKATRSLRLAWKLADSRFVGADSQVHDNAVSRRLLLAERFEVLQTLGEGAAGGVFLVRDLEQGKRQVALKVLENEQAFDEHTLERFREELSVLRSISHENVVEAYDLIDLDDTIAYTMEYVQGKDLAHVLRDRRFTSDEIVRIGVQVLDGLQALHERGIVHRDIKLENILMRTDGTIKLTDLGLMKRMGGQGMTKTGVLLGTAQYMPPEYIKRGRYDERGDLYALGVVMYELFSGKRRLADLAGNKVIEHLIKTKFAIPEMALANMPPKLRQIVQRALEIDPANRFQSAAEFHAALSAEERIVSDSDAEEAVVINPNIRFNEFEQGQPLMSWGQTRPELGRSNRLQIFGAVMGVAFIVVLGLAYLKPVPRGISISKGEYHGAIQANGKNYDLNVLVSPAGISWKSEYGKCVDGIVEPASMKLRCVGGTSSIKITNAEVEAFSGTVASGSSEARFSLVRK